MRQPSRLAFVILALSPLAFSCCFLPNVAFRLTHDGWPIGHPDQYHYAEGMSKEEIQAILGPPHARDDSEEDGEKWYYNCDAFGVSILGIKFDRNERMQRDWW